MDTRWGDEAVGLGTNWGSEEPIDTWLGVTTDADGRVTGLELSRRLGDLTGTLPAELGDLGELQTLTLSSLELSGLPPELGNLANLRSLTLSFNRLSGPLPPELGNLANLQSLTLSFNRLSGPLPPELGNLAKLESLAVSFNVLSGPIPPELGNLTRLESLTVSFNELSGPIPPELGNLASLQELTLSEGGLSGPIPPELGRLANLQTLSLSSSTLSVSTPLDDLLRPLQVDNGLSGSIPPELGKLTNLQSLALSYTVLSGSIPAELGDLAKLQTLVLSDNRLSGPIPPELGSLANLQSLALSDNHLSGSIPADLGSLANLEALALSNNQLSGPIPPELGDLAALQYVRLAGNPGLSGCVPSSLRNLLGTPGSSAASHDFIGVDGNGDGDTDDAFEGDIPGLGLPFCMLRDLRLSGAALDPPFGPPTAAYTASVDSGVAEIVVTATLHDAHARVAAIRTGGRSYANGEAVSLNLGLNTITIEVAPLDATPWQTFTVAVTRAAGPLTLPLREGGDIVVVPAGASTTADRLFGGTDVTVVWKYNRPTQAWDLSYLPALGFGGFPIEAGDVLWVVAPGAQTLTVEVTHPASTAPAGEITLTLREGGDIVLVPAGAATTADNLFGGTDVTVVWKYNRPTQAWDLSYLPALGFGGFAIESGDVLWVVATRAQTVGGPPAPEPAEPRIADPVVQLSASAAYGDGHTCAVRESGRIICWGANEWGQADAPPGQYRSVSAGWEHSCAVHVTGEILCWGRSDNLRATDAPAGKYRAVTAGARETCALGESGEIACWGYSNSGRDDVPSGSYRSLSLGFNYACALSESGEVVCWGSSKIDPIPPGTYVSVSSGVTYSCGLQESGALVCWGVSYYQSPRPHPPGTYRSVSIGRRHACAVRESGRGRVLGGQPPGRSGCPDGALPVGERRRAPHMRNPRVRRRGLLGRLRAGLRPGGCTIRPLRVGERRPVPHLRADRVRRGGLLGHGARWRWATRRTAARAVPLGERGGSTLLCGQGVGRDRVLGRQLLGSGSSAGGPLPVGERG